MKLKTAGENSIIIYFFDDIQESHLLTINQASNLLREKLGAYLIDVVPSYTSLWISFDILSINADDLTKQVQQVLALLLDQNVSNPSDPPQTIEIPIYYNKEVGLDLELLCDEKELETEEFIQIHCSKTYTAFATGFALGFAYLGILDERICSPRLATPRQRIPKNSLGIAENQTGIYPIASPGGWKIIGQTPIELVNRQNQNCPNVINIGDQVQFQPIDKNLFLKLGGELP